MSSPGQDIPATSLTTATVTDKQDLPDLSVKDESPPTDVTPEHLAD